LSEDGPAGIRNCSSLGRPDAPKEANTMNASAAQGLTARKTESNPALMFMRIFPHHLKYFGGSNDNSLSR
jgi:hypothetical protein